MEDDRHKFGETDHNDVHHDCNTEEFDVLTASTKQERSRGLARSRKGSSEVVSGYTFEAYFKLIACLKLLEDIEE